MLFPAFILLFLHSTHGTTLSANCIRQFEEFHQCRKRHYEELRAKMHSGEIDTKKVENDYQERLACRIHTAYMNCSKHFNEDCFAEHELQMMRDNDIARIGIPNKRQLPNWDSEKCPPTRDYLYRVKNGYAGFPEECNEAIKAMRSCKDRAGKTFIENFYNETKDEIENICEYQKALLFACPAQAPTTCFSPELLKKMNFWLFVERSGVPIWLRDDETCPYVKEVLDNWTEAKKFHVDAGIKVFTTNEVIMDKPVEYLGMIVASKSKSIGRNDAEKLLKIQEETKDELLFELKEKAFDKNATAIAGLKIEIYSVFEGMLNMVLYGTLVSS